MISKTTLVFAVGCATALAACASHEGGPPVAGDSGTPVDAATHDAAIPPDAGALDAARVDASDGEAGCAIPASPSGYQCDPWSTHLFVTGGIAKLGNTLRLKLTHDPDLEGNPADQSPPPAHAFYQHLTVDIALTPEVRSFLCVAFTTAAGARPVDSASASFLTDVDNHPSYSLLAGAAFDGSTHVANIADVCGSAVLPPFVAPTIAPTKPVLPDIALAIPLAPNPQTFQVGTELTGWLARGFLFVDEQGELSPQIRATVVAIQ